MCRCDGLDSLLGTIGVPGGKMEMWLVHDLEALDGPVANGPWMLNLEEHAEDGSLVQNEFVDIGFCPFCGRDLGGVA